MACVRPGVWVCLTVLVVLGGCVGHRAAVPPEIPPARQYVAAPRAPAKAKPAEYAVPVTTAVVLRQDQDSAVVPIRVTGTGPISALALSGGGANGAYGAGILSGWTARGTRPQFTVVTGISTGALLATFAFLGPKYDYAIREGYTEIKAADIFDLRPLVTWASQDSIADTAPLSRLIARLVTAEVLADVAAAYREGRRLYIGTTNLDTGRLVVWDMGAIAASGQPGALDLYRSVLLASSSIPVIFPPVLFTVYADGKVYNEMHADGGCRTQVFFRGFLEQLRAGAIAGGYVPRSRPIELYVIRNDKLNLDWDNVTPKLGPIASRGSSVMINASAQNDLLRIRDLTDEYGWTLRVTAIPQDYRIDLSKPAFDPGEMKRLYDVGYELALRGEPWFGIGGVNVSDNLVPVTTQPVTSQPVAAR